jgi:glycosyltransferase involved in cell wall biosynthesis
MFSTSDLTIAFTSYNCLYYVQLAIYSFLEHYPEYKECIVVLDDDTTEGTKCWLLDMGITRITWSGSPHIRNVKTYYTLYQRYTPQVNLSLRNSFMLKDLFSQVTTKYLIVNDADIVFLKPNFLERYYRLISSGCKLIAPSELTAYNWKLNSYVPRQSLEAYLGKYHILYDYNKDTMFRFHFFHAVLDLGFFKEHGIIFDDVEDPMLVKHILNRAVLETGSSISYEVLSRKVPFYDIAQESHNSLRLLTDSLFPNYTVYHFRWKSSFKRVSNTLGEAHDSFAEKSTRDLESCTLLTNTIASLEEKYNLCHLG